MHQHRNLLVRKDELRVGQWLAANKDELHEKRPTYTSVAAQLTELLNENREEKIAVTRDNVKGIAADLDMLWKPDRPFGGRHSQGAKDRDRASKKQWTSRTGSLEVRMDRAEDMLSELYRQLGLQEPLPATSPKDTPPLPPRGQPQNLKQNQPPAEPAANVLNRVREINQTRDVPERRN